MATKSRDRTRPRPQPRPAPPAPAPDISLQPEDPVYDTGALDDVIRTRAYFLWEQAGRPDGDGMQFWLDAQREIGNPE
jgi:Protein of unknown function (DUF2934)